MTYDKDRIVRIGSRINIDQFPKWALKAKASMNFRKRAPLRNFLDLNSPKFQINKLRQDIGQFHASRIRQESVSNASKLEK